MKSLFLCVITLAASMAGGQEAKTVEELRRAIESARATTRPATIVVAAGTYVLDRPIVITPGGGSLMIEGRGEVVLSGGKPVTGWHAAKFNGRDCWAAKVDSFVRQLWIDGRRATRARSPSYGRYFHVKESPDMTGDWQVGVSRLRFDGDDVPVGPFSYGAEAIVMTRWVESRLPIRAVDPANHLVDFSRKSQWRIEPNDPYWLEGDARFLDEPGEWFCDRDAGTIYYLPLPGQKIDAIHAVVPVMTQLVELQGSPEKNKFVENITFRGITFAHTQWMLPDPDPATTQPTASGGFAQAAVPVPAAVSGRGLRNVAFHRCTFTNMGTWGLHLSTASQNCRITQCTFRDLGAGGIKLGDEQIHQGAHLQTFANEISDCEIADAGKIFPSAVGIWLGQAFDNRIARNHIHDLYYSGISAGWSWGYGDSLNRGNIIEKNHVHDIGQKSGGDGPILADMGAIYLLGGRLGTVVRDNVLHDINGVRIAWGVYLDEGCCDVKVERNLIYRTSHGGLHLHYGRDNIIRNNIFALGRDVQLWRTREEEHTSFTFEHNIVYWTAGPLILTSPKNVKFDHNLYGGINEANFRVGELTWEKWRAAGEDRDSVLVPGPIFADVEKGDFRMKDESLAQRVGFVPFPLPAK